MKIPDENKFKFNTQTTKRRKDLTGYILYIAPSPLMGI